MKGRRPSFPSRCSAGALAIVLFAAPSPAPACGDKFLVPSRGARFRERAVDRRAVSVLLLARPGSPLDEALRTQAVEGGLRKAGYRDVVRASAAPAAALPEWDVVVTDFDDGPGLSTSLAGAPAIVPVVYGSGKAPSGEDAHRAHRRVLRSPRSPRAFLDAVDDAAAVRARSSGRRRGAPGGSD